MAEDIERGSAWQQEIESQLYESDWFLLIFSGVDEDDWSWCHHEAGLFCGMVYPDVNRVIVLYPPNVNLPGPLQKYQAVKCEMAPDGKSEDVDRFFQDMFGAEPYPGFRPINSFFAHKADRLRQEAAAKIIQAVGRLVVESIVPEAMMVVHVPNVDLLTLRPVPVGPLGLASGIRQFELAMTMPGGVSRTDWIRLSRNAWRNPSGRRSTRPAPSPSKTSSWSRRTRCCDRRRTGATTCRASAGSTSPVTIARPSRSPSSRSLREPRSRSATRASRGSSRR